MTPIANEKFKNPCFATICEWVLCISSLYFSLRIYPSIQVRLGLAGWTAFGTLEWSWQNMFWRNLRSIYSGGKRELTSKSRPEISCFPGCQFLVNCGRVWSRLATTKIIGFCIFFDNFSKQMSKHVLESWKIASRVNSILCSRKFWVPGSLWGGRGICQKTKTYYPKLPTATCRSGPSSKRDAHSRSYQFWAGQCTKDRLEETGRGISPKGANCFWKPPGRIRVNVGRPGASKIEFWSL